MKILLLQGKIYLWTSVFWDDWTKERSLISNNVANVVKKGSTKTFALETYQLASPQGGKALCSNHVNIGNLTKCCFTKS